MQAMPYNNSQRDRREKIGAGAADMKRSGMAMQRTPDTRYLVARHELK
jgi:hypothetical protein